MKSYFTFFYLTIFLFCSCTKKETDALQNSSNSSVLMLQVDYSTNSFQFGKELIFSGNSPTFTITHDYKPPGDFGSLKLTYQEINETLFEGTIIWAGNGHMSFPASLDSASQFNVVTTNDTIYPVAGFQNIFNPDSINYNYIPIWLSVQNLTKVRQYLVNNPNATVKLFLYTPGVGLGNPAEWFWIVYLKN